MSDTIYNHFFYVIKDVQTGIYYAGYKSSGVIKDFMTKSGYTTSSKLVNIIIKQRGIDSFSIEKIRVFDSKDAAYKYESKFLRKIDAKNNPRFYNMHNNIGLAPSFGTEEFEDLMMKKYGVKNGMHMAEVRKKVSQTWDEEKREQRSAEFIKLWQDEHFREKTLKSRKNSMDSLSKEERISKYGDPNRGIKRDKESYIKGAAKRLEDPNYTKKLSLACRGPRKKRTCPHCGLEGGGGNMSRYHFDNCKKHPRSSTPIDLCSNKLIIS